MADMIGFSRLGAPTAFVAPALPVAQPRPQPGIVAVSGGSGGAGASGNTALQRQAGQDRSALSKTPLELVSIERQKVDMEPPPPLDPDVQTGPPPTFEATLLQLEAQLRMTLARIEAARGLKADDPRSGGKIIGPDASAQEQSYKPADTAPSNSAEPAAASTATRVAEPSQAAGSPTAPEQPETPAQTTAPEPEAA